MNLDLTFVCFSYAGKQWVLFYTKTLNGISSGKTSRTTIWFLTVSVIYRWRHTPYVVSWLYAALFDYFAFCLSGFFEMKMKYDESDNALIRASRAVTDKMTDIIGKAKDEHCTPVYLCLACFFFIITKFY